MRDNYTLDYYQYVMEITYYPAIWSKEYDLRKYYYI